MNSECVVMVRKAFLLAGLYSTATGLDYNTFLCMVECGYSSVYIEVTHESFLTAILLSATEIHKKGTFFAIPKLSKYVTILKSFLLSILQLTFIHLVPQGDYDSLAWYKQKEEL